MSKSLIIGGVAVGTVLVAVSCTQPRNPRSSVSVNDGHWVHSARLQSIMMDLQSAAEQDWPVVTTGTDASASETARRETLDEACALAAALGDSARHIPEVAHHSGVPAERLRSFVIQAEALQLHAMQLEQAGQIGDIDSMQSILNSISTTCDACHIEFRDLAGPLE